MSTYGNNCHFFYMLVYVNGKNIPHWNVLIQEISYNKGWNYPRQVLLSKYKWIVISEIISLYCGSPNLQFVIVYPVSIYIYIYLYIYLYMQDCCIKHTRLHASMRKSFINNDINIWICYFRYMCFNVSYIKFTSSVMTRNQSVYSVLLYHIALMFVNKKQFSIR